MDQDLYGLQASGIDPEIAAQMLGLKRSRGVAEALLKQSMTPLSAGPTPQGGFTPRIHPLQGIAQIVQAYMARKGLEDADTTEAGLARQNQEKTQSALDTYNKMGAGTPEIANIPDAGPGDNDPATSTIAEKSGDKKAAIRYGLMNQLINKNPLIQYDAAMAKPIHVKADESLVDPTDKYRTILQAPKTLTEKNDQSIPANWQEGLSPNVKAGPAPGTVLMAGADGKDELYAIKYVNGKAVDYKKLDQATRVTVSPQTRIDNFLPASEEAQRDFIKSTRTTYDQLKQAPVALANIEKAKALIPSAAGFMGPAGESLLGAAKFLNNRLGTSINVEGIKDAEELRSRIFFNIMDNLKKMDAQPSQQQQAIMQEALGRLGTDPNALPSVLNAFADSINGKVELHNKEVKSAIARGIKFPYDPLIQLGGGNNQGYEKTATNPQTGEKLGYRNGKWEPIR